MEPPPPHPERHKAIAYLRNSLEGRRWLSSHSVKTMRDIVLVNKMEAMERDNLSKAALQKVWGSSPRGH